MRVAIVTQYFLPQPLANAEVIGALAAELGARGHKVDVITPVGVAREEGNVAVHRAPGYLARDRASIVGRLAEYVSFSVGAAIMGMRVPRPDVMLVPSPPPTLGLVGLLLSRLRTCPLVYNAQDLYPSVAITTGAVRPGLLTRALGSLIRVVYRHSAAVVVIDPLFTDTIRQVEPAARVESIRNGIDLAPFENAAKSAEFLHELGIPPEEQVVMYAGNVGRSQDLAPVVDATAGCGAHLVVHGGGANLDRLQAEVKTAGYRHVHFSSFRPRAELGKVFASADLHVVPLKPGIAAASVPSKLLSILAAGRPAVVAAEPTSPAAHLLQEADAGWVVRPGRPQALSMTIAQALSDREELARKGARGREWGLREAGISRCVSDYESLFSDVASRSRGQRGKAHVEVVAGAVGTTTERAPGGRQ
jgi:colanic acid biosynthesis glycosyl transferase WcaI